MNKYSAIISACALFGFLGCQAPQKKDGVNASSRSLSQDQANDDDEFFANDGNFINSTQDNKKTEIGYASWYGKELQGKPTASGELYDMNQYTAAHRDFSMGSIVLVKVVGKNKKQLVRINDRGPYVDGRIIDVSFATARKLGFAKKGVARVELKMIKEGTNNFLAKAKVENTMTEDEAFAKELENEEALENEESVREESMKNFRFLDGVKPAGHTVQVGAFHQRANAERYRSEVEDEYHRRGFIASKGKFHFVWIGDFKTKSRAEKFYQKLKTEGIDVLFKGKT